MIYTHRVPFVLVVLALLAQGPVLPSAPPAQSAQAPALPAEISLFPLPEVVLFPGVSRPLLIFEPRYRAMIADALNGNRLVATVLLRPGFEKDYEGRPPIHDIGCAGVIEQHEQLPDGRYVILLRGLTTFRILGEVQGKPYRIARIEARPERLNDEERGALSTARARIEQLLFTVLPLGVEPPDPSLDDAEFVNVVAQNLGMPWGPWDRRRITGDRLTFRGAWAGTGGQDSSRGRS